LSMCNHDYDFTEDLKFD